MPAGIYISVPFCRTKCSYCNFASGVFARGITDRYVERVCEDIARTEEIARQAGGILERVADSVYLGGGTPTILEPDQLGRIFAALRMRLRVDAAAEITVECAPGTLRPEVLETLVRCGVNRVSLGVQSFCDEEAAAVGRLHDRATVLSDIAQLRAAGISNINVDLMAGLPHQNLESWQESLRAVVDTAVPHVSVYMLEVDEESRLGREVIAGGTRYHAHFVPDDDLTADLYLEACARLLEAGIAQYEISNFTRPGMESRHNLKYWTRQPYLGFGLDAHSMLHADPYLLLEKHGTEHESSAVCLLANIDVDAVRFATTDSLESYMSGAAVESTLVPTCAALEETFFLGLRLNRGVDLKDVAARFGSGAAAKFTDVFVELESEGLLEQKEEVVRLTSRGRLLSNEVFQCFIGARPINFA